MYLFPCDVIIQDLLNTNLWVCFRTDLKKRHIEWDFKIPSIDIRGLYNISGQVLILPIIGAGNASIKIGLDILTFLFALDIRWDFMTIYDDWSAEVLVTPVDTCMNRRPEVLDMNRIHVGYKVVFVECKTELFPGNNVTVGIFF